MTLQELMGIIKDDIGYAKRESRYNKENAVQYLKVSHRHVMSLLLYNVPSKEYPKIQKITHRQKQKYARRVTWTATGFDVALNKLFGNEIKENKEYTSKITPWGLLTLDNEKYPVYSDDAGQCDYIIIDDESYSGGTYNFVPEETFVHCIISNMYVKAIKEIEEPIKENIKGE